MELLLADFGFATVGAITVICYLMAVALKAWQVDARWLPVICGIMGAILGIISSHIMPDYPANDLINAMAIGIVSGFAATGVNQVVKQLSKAT